jgi:high-affinity iron transporter
VYKPDPLYETLLTRPPKQCCSPVANGGSGWGFLQAVFGWTNSATYGSVISYNVYWLVVIAGFLTMRFYEVKGHWPLMKPKAKPGLVVEQDSGSDVVDEKGSKGGIIRTKEATG